MAQSEAGFWGIVTSLTMIGVLLYGLWRVGELHLITDAIGLFFEIFF